MPHLYLIRHAENDYVRQQRLAGRLPGIHLNETGRRQTAALAALLEPVRLHIIASSPMERAQETALPIAEQQHLTVQTLDGLNEMDYGTWQGKTLKTLRRRRIWPLIQQRPSRAAFPGGESFLAAQVRAAAVVEQLLEDFPRDRHNIACVSHADIIKLLVAHFLGLSMDYFQRIHVAPASLTIFNFRENLCQLISLNDQRASQTMSSL